VRVEGPGHQLIGPRGKPVIGRDPSLGLQVPNGETLGLFGGNIQFSGSVATAQGGRVELGALQSGEVRFESLQEPFDYQGQPGDITLRDRSLLDASGVGRGAIGIRGRDISLTGSSIALLQNQGNRSDREISVKGRDLEVSGHQKQAALPSALIVESAAAGQGGDITLSVDDLSVQDGAQVFSASYASGDGGNLKIDASQVQLSGDSPVIPQLTSSIVALAFGTGKGGSIQLDAERLQIRSGASLTTVASDAPNGGSAGNVDLQVSGQVTVAGTDPTLPLASRIASSGGDSSSANSGDLNLKVGQLVVRDGGQVRSATFSSGNAGAVRIEATGPIRIEGQENGIASAIAASAEPALPRQRKFFDLPEQVTGEVGVVSLKTPELKVFDGGQIRAVADAGSGGNLQLDTNLTFLRDGTISAAAGGPGEGGNIQIDTNALALLDGSLISANAEQGPGGNIQIDTQANFVSPDSEITASSEADVDGTVQIDTPDTNLAAQLRQFDSELLRAVRQLLACGAPGSAQAGRYRIGQSSMLPLAGSSNIARPELLSAPGGSAGGGGTNASASGASVPDSIASAIASCSGG